MKVKILTKNTFFRYFFTLKWENSYWFFSIGIFCDPVVIFNQPSIACKIVTKFVLVWIWERIIYFISWIYDSVNSITQHLYWVESIINQQSKIKVNNKIVTQSQYFGHLAFFRVIKSTCCTTGPPCCLNCLLFMSVFYWRHRIKMHLWRNKR